MDERLSRFSPAHRARLSAWCAGLAAAVLLTGCAQTQADIIADINWEVNHTRPYKYYIRKLDDARYLVPGEAGNCTDIAYTKKVELEKRGISSTVMACWLKNGQGHAFLMVPGGVLDNRKTRVITYAEVGCN